VRTTPLTCGSHASVTIMIFIGFGPIVVERDYAVARAFCTPTSGARITVQ
jgi:hypothetical protein